MTSLDDVRIESTKKLFSDVLAAIVLWRRVH